MDFYKIDNKIINNLKEDADAYVLEKYKNIIGYGVVSVDNNNIIEVFIKEEYRSNGYGKLLFGKMLEVLKIKKYKEVTLTIKKDNYRIKNIISYYGGKQLYTNNEEESYILPIK